MRRFSQRNSLVTLADINVTPLLDLAFVLLIIFIIMTPVLEQGLNLKLPGGGSEDDKKLNPRDIRTIDISKQGYYKFRDKLVRAEDIARQLGAEQARNPNLIVYIRGDLGAPYAFIAHMLNLLERVDVLNVSLRTEPSAEP